MDTVFGVTCGHRLTRLTFSRSLAELIARLAGGEVRRFRFTIGRSLTTGERSGTGLYGIVGRSGKALRVTLFRECAELWRDCSRAVREVTLVGELPNAW